MAQKSIISLEIANQFLTTVAGPYAPEIVRIYEKKQKPITDEEIEKKLKLKITEIRTILNRLHYRGISEYQKKRNEKTGWYIYTWEIKTPRIAEILLAENFEKLKKIQTEHEFGKTHSFFNCKKKCENILFELAAEYQFKCPQCGQLLSPINDKKNVKNIEDQLEKTMMEIKVLEEIKGNDAKK